MSLIPPSTCIRAEGAYYWIFFDRSGLGCGTYFAVRARGQREFAPKVPGYDIGW